MPADDHEVLKRRLKALESEMADIRDQIEQKQAAPSGKETPVSGKTPPPLPPIPVEAEKPAAVIPTTQPNSASAPAPAPMSISWKPELWIGRLGVGLLLLGVIFLFQYAVDQGWLGPWFRVATGFVLGGLLMLGGARTENVHRWFRQLLFGAALATWYLSLYAASQMYALIPGGVALFVVLGLAVGAYLLSIRERSGTIAFLATAGGLISPLYLLEGTSISAVELLLTLILSAMAMAYYLRLGGSLQVLLVFLLGGLILVEAGEGNGSVGAKVFIQISWILWGSLLLSSTLLRNQFISAGNWPKRLNWIKPEAKSEKDRSATPATLLMCFMPIVWFIATSGIWNLPKPQAGWVALALAVIAMLCRQKWLQNDSQEDFYRKVADVLLFHGVFFGMGAVVMILDGSLQLFCVSLIGFSMLQWAIRNQSGWFRTLGNFLFATSLLWTFIRVVDAYDDLTYSLGATVQCWVDFLVIVMALGQCALPWRKSEAPVYWVIGMPLLLLWLSAFVSGYTYSGPVLTLLWFTVAVSCLIGGILWKRKLWNTTSVLLLLLVLAKLFLYDLMHVDAFWRVILFLCLGMALLGTSYFISRSRQRNDSDPSNEDTGSPVSPPKIPQSGSSALEKNDESGNMHHSK